MEIFTKTLMSKTESFRLVAQQKEGEHLHWAFQSKLILTYKHSVSKNILVSTIFADNNEVIFECVLYNINWIKFHSKKATKYSTQGNSCIVFTPYYFLW